MSEKRITGPIQVFLIGFDKFEATGRILYELKRVRRRGVIRLVDLLFVQKDRHGNVSSAMHMTDLSESERMRLGAIAGGLIGFNVDGVPGAIEGAELGAVAVAEEDYGLNVDRLSELAGKIPPGTSAAVLVIEHHWATHLRDAIVEAGGVTLAQAMISPKALVMVGAELNAIMEAEDAIEAAEVVKLSAAMEVAQTLLEAELIEEAALSEAADVVATALAVEGAAEQEALGALMAADLIEDSAMEEAAEVVALALEVEDEAVEEAEDAVEAAEEIKRAAAIAAIRAIIAAKVIEEEAAEEAVNALIAADIIEEEAAEEALAAVLAAEEDAD
ncbi:MAG: DUF1269 domain-containing protein [Anaerolineae bacterium]